MRPVEDRVDELERWRRDHEARHKSEANDLRKEMADMTEAASRHVETVIKRENDKQTPLLKRAIRELRRARTERMRRRAVEEAGDETWKRRKRMLLLLTPIIVAAIGLVGMLAR